MPADVREGDPIRRLIHQLSRLPGVGEKSATRMAFHLMGAEDSAVQALAEALLEVKSAIRPCEICCNFSELSPCSICADLRRSDEMICVVEQPSDVAAIERGGEFEGRYHILHGALSPMKGIGPDRLHIGQLLRRLESGKVHEVILATNPNVEGDATALYLARLIRPLGVKTSRIAHGIPVGSELEYVDRVTLQRAIHNRREV